ncbi:acetolactate synthase large subunit [Weizmannia acidilactici]|uniref:Acetolactate synthase n=1 Tax=Weizmannia acidilactici TaxID=2607726 RepID=A0A5J4JGA2_9BACI|nr:acetolactate synthase large subunit [Weizmannia acidilactici]GER67145.1 acetolactate synthase large subunit [Weizmannia acidilactici]GER69655.1 acetolactate synthase large subunit [Weizmannia acidilactici]
MCAKARMDGNVKTAECSGAEALVQLLINEGVEVMFGYPGGAVLPIYDALYDKPIRHILTRHEQGAIHAAEGYARVTGKPGVVIATSGPGATNLITGIADAMMDSLPLVVFTGQVATSVIGSDAFQEADVIGMTAPITKHNYQVRDLRDLPRVVKEAFHIAKSGRPGPVVVDIPKNIQQGTVELGEGPEVYLPGYQPNFYPNPLQIKKLMEAVSYSSKPVILAGAGILHAKASDLLIKFAEKCHIPVVNTLLGLGSFPFSHPLFLGMGGMHGTYAANMAICECDLLINIGARFDDRLTGNLAHFAPNARVVHIDIDPAEIGKNVKTDIPIVSDAKEALLKICAEDLQNNGTDEWVQHVKEYAENYPLWYEDNDEELSPQHVIKRIHHYTNGDAIVSTDVGQHQMWAAQYYGFEKPHKWITSGGLGTMGFGFPAAIGAQIACPDEKVVAIVGDGGFQMTLQELAVVKELNLPLKIFIVNNQYLGMVRQWQESFYEERYSYSTIPVQPDFVKLAESYGIGGIRATNNEELELALKKVLQDDEAVLVDCRVKRLEAVFPMVAPGKGLHEMMGVKP